MKLTNIRSRFAPLTQTRAGIALYRADFVFVDRGTSPEVRRA
jgi:hypothetical protein